MPERFAPPHPTALSAEGAGPKDAPPPRAPSVAIEAVGPEAGASQLQYPTEKRNLGNEGFGAARVAGVRNVDA